MTWSHVAAAAVGVWCVFAPSVLGFEGSAAEWVHRIAGPLVATFSIVACWQVLRGMRWASVAGGIGLVVGSLVTGGPVAALTNGLWSGVAVMAFSLVRGRLDKRFGGGWRVLVRKPDAHG